MPKSVFLLFVFLPLQLIHGIASEDNPTSFHHGICDASGVVDLGEGEFAVADDELNLLLIYKTGESGPPLYSVEVSEFLKVIQYPKNKKGKSFETGNAKSPKMKEVDIEGATRLGDTVFWISSHGRKKSGKKASERMKIFATSIIREGGRTSLAAKGDPYNRLFQDLLEDKRYLNFSLLEASEKTPKSVGGLNIEAITDRPDGALLIGFRSPLNMGKALIVPLLNPHGVIQGEKAKFGDPIMIDLGGRGIRGLASSGGEYLIVANDPEGDSHHPGLFKWDGTSMHPTAISNLQFGDFNPEAVAILPDSAGGKVLMLSDDGGKQVGHDKCKNLQDLRLRRFRSVAIKHKELKFLTPVT